jgi:hypothetical protein
MCIYMQPFQALQWKPTQPCTFIRFEVRFKYGFHFGSGDFGVFNIFRYFKGVYRKFAVVVQILIKFSECFSSNTNTSIFTLTQ